VGGVGRFGGRSAPLLAPVKGPPLARRKRTHNQAVPPAFLGATEPAAVERAVAGTALSASSSDYNGPWNPPTYGTGQNAPRASTSHGGGVFWRHGTRLEDPRKLPADGRAA
jgi:hypothetical protein